ncbi:MAG: trypsin-like peptidase domain-containing protein [Patescibacteria group bacterium]
MENKEIKEIKQIQIQIQNLKEKFKKGFSGQKIKHLTRVFLVSLLSFVLFFVLSGVFVWKYRANIFDYFAKEYMAELATEDALNVQGATQEKMTEKIIERQSIFTQEKFVVDAVKKTNPAVVSIIISKDVPKYEAYTDPNQQNPFGNLFPNLFNIPQYRQNGTEKKEIGGGSGFFVSSDGLIVTNKHVVSQTDVEYTVLMNNGKKYPATVVARDPVLDIALIRISGTGFPSLSLGDSDKLDVGQSVIAIGNALAEFRNTVSVGVVSGLARSVLAGGSSGRAELLDHVIQTDAAINPGNSGGPLLDLSGRVIGVNVAVAQGSQSIGFALPINSVKSAIESVKSTGKIIRPYIGVRYVAINAEMKTLNNLTVDYGVLVQRGTGAGEVAVIPGSPADKAGIVENDIILEVDGVKLDNKTTLASVIRQKSVGDVINVKILSKGVEKTLRVTLEVARD